VAEALLGIDGLSKRFGGVVASDNITLDIRRFEELCHAMRLASICGLGQVVHVPIASVMKHFPEEVEAHAKGSCPAGVCFRTGAAA